MTFSSRRLSFPRLGLVAALLLALSSGPVQAGLSPPTATPTSDFNIGAGIWDITGPAAENMMSGYAKPGQMTEGIHQRLYSRAFVFATPLTAPQYRNKRVVFVNVDLNQMSQAIKSAVVDRLQVRYGPSLYTDANVMISATHTHVGPGGYAKFALYDSYTHGFQQQNFDAIVEGIYQSIVMAHERLTHGCIRKNSGTLLQANINRSPAAFTRNPEWASGFNTNTNKLMTLLKLQAVDMQGCYGDEIGLINWFAVHLTSLGNTTRLISGDNKGHAAFRFEELKGATYGGAQKGDFVAAFAQADEGDASPNVCNVNTADGCGHGDDFQDNIFSGDKQFNFAKNLYTNATDAMRLTNELDYRHAYVRMDSVTVLPAWNPAGYTNGVGMPQTCQAAIGMSFAAGAEDGRSDLAGLFTEGMTYGGFTADPDDLIKQFAMHLGSDIITAFLGAPDLPPFSRDACQLPKPVLLPTGRMGPNPWTPHTLPVQIFRIGSLAIVGVPAEVTMTAGLRLRNTVQAQLPGVSEVIIAGLSNAYSGYVTTPEEYDVQHYEGASTHFGRMTLPAYQQVAGLLAQDLRANTHTFPSLPRPADLCGTDFTPPCVDLQTDVVQDDAPWALGWNMGEVRMDAAPSYVSGNSVEVWFQAGHPKNNLLQNASDSYATVQRLNSSNVWEDVYEDTHPSVRYHWERWGYSNPAPAYIPTFDEAEYTCLACSQVQVVWKIPTGMPGGMYRIRHRGHWKQVGTGDIYSYEGKSSPFRVN